ncbi:hypothetical protein [Archangium lansingense]|uniref:Uncharacterized protein n=1 Tax=Archangium lansingense TaxID=2995310 RepID=A0ABT4AHI0_9BACT|nr:hypothetical protein [Archangium lansinium]MCY1081041.1 hypothetical protein [Archangium lansinium]
MASARTRIARALARERGEATPGETLREDELPRGLRALAASEGTDAASAAAEELLRQELEVLEWPPLFGVSVLGAALASGCDRASFIEAACTYVSLYFQELDADISRCRELVARGESISLGEAAALLRRSLDSLES